MYVQLTWHSDVAFTTWSISAASAPQSVPCYNATRIRIHRHVCRVIKCTNRYCVFVKKFNIFTYGIYCSRGRGVMPRPSCPFRELQFCEHRTWTHFCWSRCQKCVLWLSFGCLVSCWRKKLVYREAGVLAVTVLSGETVRPSTPHYFIWVCSLGVVWPCKGGCLCVCLLAFHGHM